ncbi:MAG: ATP-binding protein [Anaerolineales bacterium]|nr:ATP-binding protein [Anaerolineales bacterium]
MDDINAKIQIASYRILQAITPRKQAQYVMAVSAALAMVSIALPGANLPPSLAVVATGLGVEALGSLLSDLVHGKDVSNEEIVSQVEKALPAETIDDLLTTNRQLVVQITRLASWQRQIKFIIERDQNLAESLTQEFGAVAEDIAAVREALEQTATREQSEELKGMIQQVITLLKPAETANDTILVNRDIQNPFGCTGKIQDLANYLVRQPLTNDVFAELEKGVSVSIVGESQSGKSSLLWYVCREGPAILQRPETDFLYLDMQLLSNDDDFFDYLCTESGVPLGRGYRLARALRGRKIVLCIDEIEKMTWKGFSRDIRTELRGLADGDGSQTPLTLVIAGRSPLNRLFPDSPNMTSPLAGICIQYDILPFTLVETEALVAQYLGETGLTLPNDLVTEAWRQSHGQPAQLQRALQAAYSRFFGTYSHDDTKIEPDSAA